MSSSNHRKIQRLPALLLAEEKEENDYYPKVVSIGPYHHGKSELAQVEAFKPMAVELLVRNPEEKESLYRQVLGMIGEVRNCYEVTGYSDDYLAQMMLQDASLIIINMTLNKMGVGQQQRASDAMIEHLGMLTIATLFRDFFLVENQVPLGVLELLIRLVYGEGSEREVICNYLMNIYFFGEDRPGVISSQAEAAPPLHLLEVMHRILVSDCVEAAPKEKSCNGCVVRLFSSRNEATEIRVTKYTYSFRTATDLKAKGIHFRPSASRSLKDVGFKSAGFYATVRLPRWFVSPCTKHFLKNLVAYELLPGVWTEPVVVAYVDLMQFLVERAEDVKELRESGVLYHGLRSDEEVLNVYKSINTHGACSHLIFSGVKLRILVHCNSRTNTWMAELIHTYFRSPWTLIAFLAATTVIALTAAQLYYALPSN